MLLIKKNQQTNFVKNIDLIMNIRQFEDINLAHFSYAIESNKEIVLIDPARNPKPYYDFAQEHNANIIAVIETHPHADFVSSHLEIHNKTNATIYASKLLGADYPHEGFDDGDSILIGDITLKSINTPGHSPDSISILVFDKEGAQHAVFTGDTLFIGDCGRPDLREKAGAITSAKADLAKQMYHSLREKLLVLNENVIVYPAHGAGSLCGKGLSQAKKSTIAAEKISNWSLQHMSEEEFIKKLLSDQPFIPKYFPFDVGINKKGANDYLDSISKIKIGEIINRAEEADKLNPEILIIDTRPQAQFKARHLKGSINLMNDTKFETWLGSIVSPGEKFYLAVESEKLIDELIDRITRIGYESQIEMVFVLEYGNCYIPIFDSSDLKSHLEDYTIIDVRNSSEVATKKIFPNAINIPLHELRERINEVPLAKPILVHCSAGYRSAAASSILQSLDKVQVFDLSYAVKQYLA